VIPVVKPVTPRVIDTEWDDARVFIHTTISSSAPEFAEATPIMVHAVGDIGVGSIFLWNMSDLQDIYTVCICFRDAYWLRNGQIVLNSNQQPYDIPYAGVLLSITHTRPSEPLTTIHGPGGYLVGDNETVEWQNPTDSVPAIIITYSNFMLINGVLRTYVIQSFPDKYLHIESSSTLVSDRTNAELPLIEIVATGLVVAQILLSAVAKLRQPKMKPRRINQVPF